MTSMKIILGTFYLVSILTRPGFSTLFPNDDDNNSLQKILLRDSAQDIHVARNLMTTNIDHFHVFGSGKIKIIMPSDSSYVKTFFNWLIFFLRHCPKTSLIEDLYFICLDEKNHEQLSSKGITCSRSESNLIVRDKEKMEAGTPLDFSELWRLRVNISDDLLRSGYDVLLADSDVIWIKNPFPVFNQYDDSDIISTRGIFTTHISTALGATLCMGFMYIKSNLGTIELWTKMKQIMDDEKRKNKFSDDQIVLNKVLVHEGLQYDVKRLKYPFGKDVNFGTIVSKTTNETILKIALLPHISFQRICVDETDVEYSVLNATIAHCNSPKDSKNKRSTHKRMRIWELNDE